MRFRMLVPALGCSSTLAILLALAPSGAAQISVDHAFRGTFGPPGIDDMLDTLGTPPVSTVPITGLSTEGAEINACALDPVTGDLFLGGIGLSAGELRRVTLSGTSVASESVFATKEGLPLRAIDFDQNGDLYFVNVEKLYQVSRTDGTVTEWDEGRNYLGSFNALCTDLERNLMWAATFSLTGSAVIVEYDLSAVSPYLGGPSPTVILETSAAGLDSRITGLDDDENLGLYVTTHNSNGQSVFFVDASVSPAVVITDPLVPREALNDVWYDRKHGTIHLVGAGLPTSVDDYFVMTFGSGTAAANLTENADVGVPSNIVVNDLTGRTELFPRSPDALTPVTLELAAHGGAGDLAGVWISAVSGVPVGPFMLGSGFCDNGGFFTVSFSVSTGFAAGTTIDFGSATIDSASGSLLLGTTVTLSVPL